MLFPSLDKCTKFSILLLLSIPIYLYFNILKIFLAKWPLSQNFLLSVLGKHPKQRIEGNSKDFKNIIKWKIRMDKRSKMLNLVCVSSNVYGIWRCTWRSENSLGKSVLSFHHVLPWIQLMSLGLAQSAVELF